VESGNLFPLYSKMENNYTYLCFLDITRKNTLILHFSYVGKLGWVRAVDIDPLLTVGAPVVVSLNASQGRFVFGAPRRESVFGECFGTHQNFGILTEFS
jgi:hypothetical protein